MGKILKTIIYIYLTIRFFQSCATSDLHELSQDQLDSIKLKSPITIEPLDLEIIPPSLGVQFYRDGIIFLADSKNEEKISSGYVSFGTLQAYYASFRDTLGRHFIFSPKPIFQYPCDALTFSSDFGTMYYTKPIGKQPREKIFRAENFIIGENRQMWTFDPEPLEFCREESIYSHPALSVDGSFMLFASDVKGSEGGMDLFITRNRDMTWSEPENLGKVFNTKGNEIFPVLDRNNNLFFSSNGIKGSEGYDIFVCKFNGKGWDFPLKLTNLINTKNDEFAFTIDRLTGNSAFFTSRKDSRNASLQLFRISPKKNLESLINEDLVDLLWDMSSANIDSSEIKLMLKQLKAEKMKADSLEKVRIETVRLDEEKIREDSISAVKLAARKLEDDRTRIAKVKADSLAAVKLNAMKLQADKVKAAKMKADSLVTAKLTSQKNQAEKAKVRNDSILAAKKEAERRDSERLKLAQIKADSIMISKKESDRLEAMRIKAERLRLDSLEALRLEADRRANPDIITYKVQFISSIKPKAKFNITVDGVVYNTNEYFYLNEYRYTIGEFSTLEPAKYLQFGCRRSGYPQAFVVAFKNGQRSLDMGLFK